MLSLNDRASNLGTRNTRASEDRDELVRHESTTGLLLTMFAFVNECETWKMRTRQDPRRTRSVQNLQILLCYSLKSKLALTMVPDF